MSTTPERAYGLYLAQSEYRRPMIEWAMDRLAGGSVCPSTILLAGADFEPDDEVLRLFRRAAVEEGIELPAPDRELVRSKMPVPLQRKLASPP